MGLFKGIAMSAIDRKADGGAVFYPFSISKGYLLTSEEVQQTIKSLTFEIRLYIGMLLSCALIGYLFPSNWSVVLLLGIVLFCVVRYFVIVLALISKKQIIKERFKIKSSLESSLIGHSYLSLAFLAFATAYLGEVALRESVQADTAVLQVMGSACLIFSAAHFGFIFWKWKSKL